MSNNHDEFDDWWDLTPREILRRPQYQWTRSEWLTRLQVFMQARAAFEAAEASKAMGETARLQQSVVERMDAQCNLQTLSVEAQGHAIAEMQASTRAQKITAWCTLGLAIATFGLAGLTFWLAMETSRMADLQALRESQAEEPPPGILFQESPSED